MQTNRQLRLINMSLIINYFFACSDMILQNVDKYNCLFKCIFNIKEQIDCRIKLHWKKVHVVRSFNFLDPFCVDFKERTGQM